MSPSFITLVSSPKDTKRQKYKKKKNTEDTTGRQSPESQVVKVNPKEETDF